MNTVAAERRAASRALIEAALWVDPAPQAAAKLRDAAADPGVDWDWVAKRIEAHGILRLVRRNLDVGGVTPPPRIAERDVQLAEDARRATLTLDRFLAETARRRIDVILLKGAALELDLYPERGLRSQGDVDVLVRDRDFASAVAAARSVGLVLGPRQFPTWWYRLVHFHLKLHPGHAFAKEMEIHWRLHAPAQLFAVRIDDLWRRARPTTRDAADVFVLDPLDGYLHLATHLVSHGLSASDWPTFLVRLLDDDTPAVRLKWIVDLVAATAWLDGMASSDILARADAWNARAELALVTRLLGGVPGLDPRTRTVLRELDGPSAPKRSSGEPGAGAAAPASWSLSARPFGGLDFRLAALARLPRWIWPPLEALGRKRRVSSRLLLLTILRPIHAAGVLLFVLLAAFVFPFACFGRFVAARGRRQAMKAALAPEKVLDLTVRWRQLAATESLLMAKRRPR